MVQVVWDPNWFPPEDMDDVILMRRVYLSSINTVQIEYIENKIISTEYTGRSYIKECKRPIQSFIIDNKSWKREVSYGYKNNKKYLIYLSWDPEFIYTNSTGAIIFGYYNNFKDWENFFIDWDAEKDISHIIKYKQTL